MTGFWDIALFSIVEANRRFIGAYCLQHPDGPDDDDNGTKHL
jgi:hypothetical protein